MVSALKKIGWSLMLLVVFSMVVSTAVCAEKLVIWDKSEYVKVYNDRMKEFAENFTKQTGVEVEYVVIPPNDLKPKIYAAIEAKNPPDLIVTDDFVAKQFAGMDQLVDVSDIYEQVNFTEAAMNLAYVKNGNFVIPQAFLAPGMYVRKDKWDAHNLKYPDTWAEVKETARIVNDPKNGFHALGFPMGASGGGDAEGMMRCVVLGFGGVPVDREDNITVNSPETLEALKFVASLYQEGLTPPSAITWDDMGNNTAYLSETVGLIMNSGSVYSTMKNEGRDELLKNTVILPFPAGPAGRFISGGGNVFVIFKNGKNTQAAKQFVIEFFKKDFYEDLIIQIGGMWQPTVEGMSDNDFWKQGDNKGWLASSLSIVPNTHPAQPDDKSTRAFSEQLLVKAVQKIVLQNMDPQQALDECEADFKRIYEQ
ncbi:hypothetical protein U27_04965 [Candidatus Vecturithrix granuli]|uniref:Extracellular solute-binding protein family 1 n=1 Tax=Vecturithrix granuli TaxID=1499967 RepID=A0A081C087_VECG1|nr:hypothetical protein U27_04965 [Candidatus Vecturithrix granuli]